MTERTPQRGMNQRRLTDLSASFLKNDSKHFCGIQFSCPKCVGNCWHEARWSDRELQSDPIYQRAPSEGLTLENITLSPGLDTPCGTFWVHDGEVIWP